MDAGDSELRRDGLFTPTTQGIELLINEATQKGWVQLVHTRQGGRYAITKAGIEEWINRRLPPNSETPVTNPRTRRQTMTKMLDAMARDYCEAKDENTETYDRIDAASRTGEWMELVKWLAEKRRERE